MPTIASIAAPPELLWVSLLQYLPPPQQSAWLGTIFNCVPHPLPCLIQNPSRLLAKLSTGFNNVDCSNGTCEGCSGIFGFDFESAVVATAESGGTVNLTLVRLAGTDGEVSVTVDIIRGNATVSSDYGGTWPTQVCDDDDGDDGGDDEDEDDDALALAHFP